VGRISLEGRWQVRVVGKEADWPQRVVIDGSSSLVIPGVVGHSATVTGKHSYLTVEHELGGQWRENELVQAAPARAEGGRTSMLVVSKDHYWPGDSDPDDLVLELVQLSAAGSFGVAGVGAADETLRKISPRSPAGQYLAVEIVNDGAEPFGYDEVLDISEAGSAALAAGGIELVAWSQQDREVTGQETFGDAVSVPPLEPGQHGTVYFPADFSAVGPDPVQVEFELRRSGGHPGTGTRCSSTVQTGTSRPAAAATATDPGARVQAQAGSG
jgi:hypothetical protein